MMYKEYNHITAEYKGYKGAIYKDNMFGLEFCNMSVYGKDGKEVFHATLDNTKTYTKNDVISHIKWFIKKKRENEYYYLRKDDRALYKHCWYNRFFRSSYPEPSDKSFRLYKVKRLSTILRARENLHEYCNEWFDVYDQCDKKIEIESNGESRDD